MNLNSTITYIKGQQVLSTNSIEKGIRVAAYCRVSTDGEEQLNSFTTQMRYYNDKIKSNPNWIYVGVYSDEAITGTKIELREGFQKMINDCLNGKIDLIITKSISRFARNTVDTLNIVRKLKEKRIAVFFEEENINTLTMDGELLLTILSSVAQQEVQNISEHVKKGLKMKLQQGATIGFPPCYGFDHNPITKEVTINQEEAKIVSYVFERYAAGVGTQAIAKELREMRCVTKKGSYKWSSGTIRCMIRNEKYKGDLLYGKTYTVDPIGKKRVKNNGEYDQMYIENHHEPIVSRELWEKANEILNKRRIQKNLTLNGKFEDFIGKYPLSKKIKCGFCGATYTRRSHSQTVSELKPVWKCRTNTSQGVKYCNESKSIDDAAIKKAFIEAMLLLVKKDDNLIESFMQTLKENILVSEPKQKILKMQEDIKYINIRKNKAIDLLLDGTLSKEEYDKRSYEYIEKINKLEEEIAVLETLDTRQDEIISKLELFKSKINGNLVLDDFDKDICDAIVDKIIVGGYDENNNKNPYLVTIVFDIAFKSTIQDVKEYYELGEFYCEYDFYSFDINEYGSRTKVRNTGFPVKIALKIK